MLEAAITDFARAEAKKLQEDRLGHHSHNLTEGKSYKEYFPIR